MFHNGKPISIRSYWSYEYKTGGILEREESSRCRKFYKNQCMQGTELSLSITQKFLCYVRCYYLESTWLRESDTYYFRRTANRYLAKGLQCIISEGFKCTADCKQSFLHKVSGHTNKPKLKFFSKFCLKTYQLQNFKHFVKLIQKCFQNNCYQ